jgi:putative chitinase
MALDSLIAARILFRGMAEGWFTGKKLGQYFNDDRNDPVNARQIVNGNDDDELIAGYHRKFLAALQASAVGEADVGGNLVVTVIVSAPPGIKVDMQAIVNDNGAGQV